MSHAAYLYRQTLVKSIKKWLNYFQKYFLRNFACLFCILDISNITIRIMSDMAPSGPLAVLKTEPGGNLSQGDTHNSLVGITQLSSVVVGLNGSSNGGGMMMPTIISDESISAPGSPMGSGKV